MSYSELLVALQNIVVDKVATVPTVMSTRPDTSTPMEIGMSAKDDGESTREEGYQSIVDFALQGEEGFRKKVRIGGIKGTMVAKVAKMGGESPWQKSSGKKGCKGARERWQGRRQNLLDVWKSKTHGSVVSERRQQ